MKRYLLLLCSGVLFGVLVIAPALVGDAAETHAGTQADPFILWHSETVHCEFDNNYGTLQIMKAEVEVSLNGVVVRTVVRDGMQFFPMADLNFKVPFAADAETFADGLYTARARVTDYIGNTSGWCAPVWFRKQWAPPAPPGGCAILR